MTLEELEKEEFSQFLNQHPLRTFFQTVEMEKIGLLEHFESHYVGVKENGKILAASRIVSKKVRFGKKIFYAPRGLLVDYENKPVLTFFVKELKKYIKKRNGYTLHIDPTVIYKERDIDGEIVEGGVDHSEVVSTLKELGFHHDGFIRYYDPTKQVRWSFELPLVGKSKEQILKEMNGNTRRAIQKAEHWGVVVRELSKEELPIFKDIMQKTSERKEFKDHTLTYYETMYDLFHEKGEIQYMLAEINLDKNLEILKKDIEEMEAKLEKAKRQKKEALERECESQITSLKKRKELVFQIRKEKGKILPLSCGMFMIYGKDILYYFAGSYKEYMHFFGQYLIQWKMICKAIELKKECYNFYGIKGVFEKDDKDYGLYLFKRGFNGHVIEYIGDFYLPISFYFYLQDFLGKLRKKEFK